MLRAALHPIAVVPFVIEVPHHRRGLRRRLLHYREGIGLVDAIVVVLRADVKLVMRAFAGVRDESFPDAGRAAMFERMLLRIPAVPVAHHADRRRVRRPHGEHRSAYAAAHDGMRSEFLPEPGVAPFIEEVIVPIAEERLWHRHSCLCFCCFDAGHVDFNRNARNDVRSHRLRDFGRCVDFRLPLARRCGRLRHAASFLRRRLRGVRAAVILLTSRCHQPSFVSDRARRAAM